MEGRNGLPNGNTNISFQTNDSPVGIADGNDDNNSEQTGCLP